MRISFMPAHAHLIFTCSCASHFCLRICISFLPAHAHLIFTCSCASHFGLRMRISFRLAHAHLNLACACASYFGLHMKAWGEPAVGAAKTLCWSAPTKQNSHKWSSPAPAPCAKCSHLHLGKRNNTCSCCARPGRLHWPVLNVWWTPNPNCRQMLMQISANK